MQVWKRFSQFEQTYGDLTSMLKACVLSFLLYYFCLHLVTVDAVCVCVQVHMLVPILAIKWIFGNTLSS